jgi:CHAT domain-containing protein
MDIELSLARGHELMDRALGASDVDMLRAGMMTVWDVLPRVTGDDELRVWALGLLGSGLVAEYDLTGLLSSLQQAVSIFRDALLLPAGDAREDLVLHLAAALQQSYVVRQDEGALVEALTLLRAEPQTPPVQAAIGRLLLRRFELESDRAVLDEAINLLEAANQSGQVPDAAIALGGALARRAEVVGGKADLLRGIKVLEELIAILPPTGHNGAIPRVNLSGALLRAFDITGDETMLSRAIDMAEAAANAVPEDATVQGVAQSALANALHRQFNVRENPGVLDRAVAAARAALTATPPEHSERHIVSANLASVLQTRYGAYRATEDVSEANALLAAASADAPGAANQPVPSSADNAGYVAMGLMQEFDLTRDTGALARAITALERAIPQASALARPHLTFSLGAALATLAEATDDVPLLDRAISIFEKALDANSPDSLTNSSLLGGLGKANLHRFLKAGDPADLDRAVSILTRAYHATPAADFRRVPISLDLGTSLGTRSELRQNPSDARQAAEVYRSAALEITAPTHDRAMAAWGWAQAELALGSYHAALDGYETAVGLLDLVAWRGLRAEDRERLLADFGDLARDAGACAIAADRPERAIELLEQGRGVLLSQALDARSGHDVLAEQAPELADRLAFVNDRLDTRADIGLEQRMSLAREREELLRVIRKQPGQADFLRPPRLDDIRPGQQDGPVVFVNVAQLRTDALIVGAHQLTVVELGDLSAQVARHASALLATTDIDSKSAADLLAEILAWLYSAIWQPVLAALPAAESPRRVWWCPTGQLALLPLHAAGSPEGSALDAAISSYIPTLRVLRRTRQDAPADPNASVLSVTPDSHPPLPAVSSERPSFHPAMHVTELVGPQATVARVHEELPKHCWMHFAGHAAQDLNDPASGQLALSDGALTVRAIMARRLEAASFAYLAACETARGGMALADEAITLVTALQIAGFRHVVGTLWPVPDPVAARFTRAFYAAKPGAPPDAADAAAAVHAATIKLRERYASDPRAWAGFVHSGP